MKNRNIIKLYCVEYACIDGGSTYEIFRTLDEAKSFAYTAEIWDYNSVPLYIFSSDFNANCIFEEDDGQLNYEDYADTLQENFVILKEVGKKPAYFEE